MKITVWLPFLLAPVIGGGIGWYLFDTAHEVPAQERNPATAASRAMVPRISELANVFDDGVEPVVPLVVHQARGSGEDSAHGGGPADATHGGGAFVAVLATEGPGRVSGVGRIAAAGGSQEQCAGTVAKRPATPIFQ